MSERDDDRLDLSALGKDDPVQADRVVRAALQRIAAPQPMLADLAAWWRPGLAAAAVIGLLALGVALTRQRSEATAVPALETRLLQWAESGYVPSNGELLAAVRGYSQ